MGGTYFEEKNSLLMTRKSKSSSRRDLIFGRELPCLLKFRFTATAIVKDKQIKKFQGKFEILGGHFGQKSLEKTTKNRTLSSFFAQNS